MKIKKYAAKSMPEALQLVRDELGEAAVILSTRQLPGNSSLNQQDGACVEVTAAMDETVAPARHLDVPLDPARGTATAGVAAFAGAEVGESRVRGLGGVAAARRYAVQVGAESLSPSTDPTAMPGLEEEKRPLTSDVERAVQYLRSMTPAAREAVPGPAQVKDVGDAPGADPGERAGRRSALNQEERTGDGVDLAVLSVQLTRLQETVSLLHGSGAPTLQVPDPVVRLADRMRNMGLAEEIANRVVQWLFDNLERDELNDRALVAGKAVEALLGMLPSYREMIRVGRRKKTIGFVGASGSGKTTAAAKIAAGFAMKRKDRIVVITADDRRVGAVDQVQAFANIIDIPLELAYGEEDFDSIALRYEKAQLVLVDMPGCGAHDRQGWERQRRLLEAAGGDEVQVVIDGMASIDHMMDLIEATEVFPNRRLLFTKLDELVRPGAVISAAVRSGISVSYLVNGPEVPGAIEAANLPRLVTQIVGDESVQEQV